MTTPSTIPPEIARKLDELQRRIEQADVLEKARRVDEAQAAYHACNPVLSLRLSGSGIISQ